MGFFMAIFENKNHYQYLFDTSHCHRYGSQRIILCSIGMGFEQQMANARTVAGKFDSRRKAWFRLDPPGQAMDNLSCGRTV
jgi:hypothetical protein